MPLIRVQQRRTAGWRMPDNTMSVARPSKWGNPFKVGETYRAGTWQHAVLADMEPAVGPLDTVIVLDAATAVEAFARWLIETPQMMVSLRELAGRNLACWCPPTSSCHADVLLELANPSGAVSAP